MTFPRSARDPGQPPPRLPPGQCSALKLQPGALGPGGPLACRYEFPAALPCQVAFMIHRMTPGRPCGPGGLVTVTRRVAAVTLVSAHGRLCRTQAVQGSDSDT